MQKIARVLLVRLISHPFHESTSCPDHAKLVEYLLSSVPRTGLAMEKRVFVPRRDGSTCTCTLLLFRDGVVDRGKIQVTSNVIQQRGNLFRTTMSLNFVKTVYPRYIQLCIPCTQLIDHQQLCVHASILELVFVVLIHTHTGYWLLYNIYGCDLEQGSQ